MVTKPKQTAIRPRKSAAKPPPATKAGKLAPVEVPVETSKANAALKLKVLIDRVTEASGAKRKDVKTVVEATLIQLGQALARGEAMNLPRLGHLRVARKATEDVPSMTLKLRQGEPGKAKPKAAGKSADTSAEDADKEPLAEDSDQG